MYTIQWFGQNYQGTGSIRETMNANGVAADGQDPYVGGQQVSMDSTPAAGSRVTFRPKASGKAKNSGKRRGR